MATVPAFASVSEAMEMVRAGLAFVASADAAELTTGEQAECLRQMEQANSVLAAEAKAGLGCGTWPSWPPRSWPAAVPTNRTHHRPAAGREVEQPVGLVQGRVAQDQVHRQFQGAVGLGQVNHGRLVPAEPVP